MLPTQVDNNWCSLYNFVHKKYNIGQFINNYIGIKTGVQLNDKEYCLIEIQTTKYQDYIIDYIYNLTMSNYNNLLYVNASFVQSFPFLVNSNVDLKIKGKGEYIVVYDIQQKYKQVPFIQYSDLVDMLVEIQGQFDINIISD